MPEMLKVEIAGGNMLDVPAGPSLAPFTSSEDRRTQQPRGGGMAGRTGVRNSRSANSQMLRNQPSSTIVPD
jgi:hypothetical protein